MGGFGLISTIPGHFRRDAWLLLHRGNMRAMSKYQFTCEVAPQYLSDQSSPQEGVYAFAYTITITNSGAVAAQLIARHWIIDDERGHTEEVKGLGVVGHQPLLQPGEAFQYTSGTRLQTASGKMRGSFFCVAEDGERFDCTVAPFVLQAGSPSTSHTLH
jgi:ApaG protein